MNGATAARAVGLAAGAMAVEAMSSTHPGRRVDRCLFGAVNRGHGVAADAIMGALTELGAITASAGAAGVLAAAGRRGAAARGLGAATTTWVLGQALKRAYHRARPYEALPEVVRLLIARPSGTSWPSSHPAVLLALVTAAGHDLGLSPARRAALTALACAVAGSRVYLGVHYPSDVVAGLMLGGAVGLAWSAPGRTVQ